MTSKKIRTTTCFPEDIWESLGFIAEHSGFSKNSLTVSAVRSAIPRWRRQIAKAVNLT